MSKGKDFFETISSEKGIYKEQNSEKLNFCLGMCFRTEIDKDYISFFEKIILAKWHEEYENIVDIVREFKDDRFSESLKQIIIEPEIYRNFDDENEATLRKCIHALKEINSEKSISIINDLRKSNNKNIEYALEMHTK